MDIDDDSRPEEISKKDVSIQELKDLHEKYVSASDKNKKKKQKDKNKSAMWEVKNFTTY